jgi:hypothetical protein
MTKKILTWLFLMMFFAPISYAQYTEIGEGGFSSTSFGPMKSSTTSAFYSRYAYIYPSGSLTSLKHGDSMTAFEFKHLNSDTLAGNCTLKIYVKSTTQADFGSGSFNWLAETRNNMTLVYSGNPKDILGSNPGDALFLFNQVNTLVFDTTGGAENLEILVEYTQNTNQWGAISFSCESGFYVPAFISNNETKYISGSSTSGMDSITTGSTAIKPTLKIYHADQDTDLEPQRIYALGTVPVLMNRADSIKTVIQNVGKKTVYNHKIYLDVTGSNTFQDSLILDSIHPFEKKFVYFSSHQADTIGAETIKVTVAQDSNQANNSMIKNRLVNYNNFSQADPFQTSSGGIGFNGSTGDFVSKFYVGGTSYINQIKVDFNLAGRDFQLVVWDDDGPDGLPGTELFVSDSSTSVSGTFIMSVLPRIQISGGFFVGIRQTSTSNVSFSFQYEKPVRPHTFYFTAPAGDSNWTPFAPGFDFNFNIQPRLQVANDLGILAIVNPEENDTFRYHDTDSLELTASIINYGYQNQGSFNATMEVYNRFNQKIYTSVRTVSLNAGDTVQVDFDKFSKYNIGEFRAKAFVNLNTDSVSDNNSKEVTFYLVKDHDVAVDIIYSPVNNDSFDINREGFWPTVRIINYGVENQFSFPVRAELINSKGEVVDSQIIAKQLSAGLNEIITFDSMFLRDEGSFIFRAYTQLYRDSFPSNDSAAVTIHAKKSDDVKMLGIIKPQHLKKYVHGTEFEPYVVYRNDGLNDQDSTYFFASIKNAKNQVIYTDTILRNTPFFSNGQIILKPFDADSLGDYLFEIRNYIKDDQLPKNDTLSARFSVVTGNDLQIMKLVEPFGLVAVGSASTQPKILVRNNGLNHAVNAPISIVIENHLAQEVYSDTVLVNINSFTNDTISFTETLSYDNLGDYFVTITNLWSNENEPSEDDTLITGFGTRYSKDLVVVANIAPKHNDTFELEEEIRSTVQIANYGLDSLFDVEIQVVYTNSQNVDLYTDTLFVASLPPSSGNNVSADSTWRAIEGDYTCTATFLGIDDNDVNNLVQTKFVVVERLDVKIDSVLFPKNGSRLRVNSKYKPEVTISNDGIEDLDQFVVQTEVLVDGSRIYVKSGIISLKAGRDTTIQFDSSLSHDEVTEAEAIFVVSLIGDQDVSNDTIFTVFDFVDGAGVKDEKYALSALVYPNPNNGEFEVSSKDIIDYVKVFNLNGQLILEIEPKTKQVKVSLDTADGEYIVELGLGNSVERHRLIKQD